METAAIIFVVFVVVGVILLHVMPPRDPEEEL